MGGGTIKKLELSTKLGFEKLLDETTALLKVKVCSSRDNAHELYIEDDALIAAAPSVLGKPIVAKYDRWTKDVMGHEDDEIPIGYVIDNQTPQFVKEENGAISLVVFSILWKEYVPEVFEIFTEKDESGQAPIKSVSMEIYLNDVAIDDDNNEIIKQFQFKGITLLGDDRTPACELAHAEMIAFEAKAKRAEMLFSLEMSQNNQNEKEDVAVLENEKECAVAEEEKVSMATGDPEQAPPDEEKPESVETPEQEETEEDMACKKDMSAEEAVDYQVQFEELSKQFSELKADYDAIKASNEALMAKFSEIEENEKMFAIEQVLSKFESKLSQEQASNFRELAKEVPAKDVNIFCNEIKAFVADLVCEKPEVEFSENRMSILKDEPAPKESLFDWK